ncbi:hypothetical protein SDC9_69171 [bioreactor metagenome]|uniref:2-dehydropantoate 2-reductase n=1 Tax=bioreactor metagenome TaxID=1076179 RepID=A0A644Y824_9ZZZZ
MEINTVSIIGLGALGVLFSHHLSRYMPADRLRIVADAGRIGRYQKEQVFCNGEPCRFHYVSPEEDCTPADLLIFCVKYQGLADAIEESRNQVGPNTIIISLLNGISSEEIIGRTFGMDKLLYSVAQGMDAVKVGNQLAYQHMGIISFGDRQPGGVSESAGTVARFFDKTCLPYEVSTDMPHKMWGKLMFNVGVNQTVAVFESDYSSIQREGPARDTMISAMKEVVALSEKENVNLTQSDLDYWFKVLDGLNPRGKPSMRQDLEAKRKSEVELFAGTVLALGRKHNLSFPTNQMLYDKITEMESQF